MTQAQLEELDLLNDKDLLGIWAEGPVREQILRSLDHQAAEAERNKPIKRTFDQITEVLPLKEPKNVLGHVH